jgi:DNA-binding MarR family transcriptional regulator
MVLLPRLAKQIFRRSTEELLGLQIRQLIALSYLRDHGGAPQQELADALCIDANNVVLLLNELEAAGYATRHRDPQDRRRHRVEITPDGGAALDRAYCAHASLEDEILGALDADERATLAELLGRALQGLERGEAAEAASAAR